jgi:hypothetical protein
MTDSILPISAEHEEVRQQSEGAADAALPAPEIVSRPKRRTLTIAYKLRIINAVVALRAEGHGAVVTQ